MQIPSASCGADKVVASLDDRAWNVLQDVGTVDDLRVFLEETSVDKVVRLNPCKGDRELRSKCEEIKSVFFGGFCGQQRRKEREMEPCRLRQQRASRGSR